MNRELQLEVLNEIALAMALGARLEARFFQKGRRSPTEDGRGLASDR